MAAKDKKNSDAIRVEKSGPEGLPAFGALAKESAESMRNVAALSDLDLWLGDIVGEKVGERFELESDPLPESNGVEAARARKVWDWATSVGRGHMARKGELRVALPEELAELAKEEPWIESALKAGKKLSFLKLGAEEGDALRAIVDWLRAPTGPALESDWTRISWPQAVAGHESWIEELSRAARKNMQESQAFDGCELLAPVVDTPALDGWTWVEVKASAALDREGALMKHCVGSYAARVASGSCLIYSLRDVLGKPHVTVEARMKKDGGCEVVQVQGNANSRPKELQLQALPSMVEGLRSVSKGAVQIAARLMGKTLAGVEEAPTGFGEKGRLWRKGHQADARSAVGLAVESAKASAKNESSNVLSIPKFLDKMGYESALRVFIKEPAANHAWLGQLVEWERDDAKMIIEPGVDREELGRLRDAAMARGMKSIARACQSALVALPESAYEGETHCAVEKRTLERFERCMDAVEAMVGVAKASVEGVNVAVASATKGVAGGLNVRRATDLGKARLKKSWEQSDPCKFLVEAFESSRDRTVYANSTYLVALLAREVEKLRSAEPRTPAAEMRLLSNRVSQEGQQVETVSLSTDWKSILAQILVERCDESGRLALIDGISGMGVFDTASSKLGKSFKDEERAALAAALAEKALGVSEPSQESGIEVGKKLRERSSKAGESGIVPAKSVAGP